MLESQLFQCVHMLAKKDRQPEPPAFNGVAKSLCASAFACRFSKMDEEHTGIGLVDFWHAGPRVRFAEGVVGEEENVQTRAHVAEWWERLLAQVTRPRRRRRRQSSARSSRGSSRSRAGDVDGNGEAEGGGGGGLLSEEWWLDLLIGGSDEDSSSGSGSESEWATEAELEEGSDDDGDGGESEAAERLRRGEARDSERYVRARDVRVRARASPHGGHTAALRERRDSDTRVRGGGGGGGGGVGGGDSGSRWMGVRAWWREEMQTLGRVTAVLRRVSHASAARTRARACALRITSRASTEGLSR